MVAPTGVLVRDRDRHDEMVGVIATTPTATSDERIRDVAEAMVEIVLAPHADAIHSLLPEQHMVVDVIVPRPPMTIQR